MGFLFKIKLNNIRIAADNFIDISFSFDPKKLTLPIEFISTPIPKKANKLIKNTRK